MNKFGFLSMQWLKSARALRQKQPRVNLRAKYGLFLFRYRSW